MPAQPTSTGSLLAWPTQRILFIGAHWKSELLGRAGSEHGKCIHGYSPISHIIKAAGTYEAKLPTTMKALRSRKAGAMTLVDTILSHAAKAGGVRIEARLRGPAILQEALEDAEQSIEGLMALLGEKVILKKLPVALYMGFLQHELAASIDAQTFAGMRDSGPNPENTVQVEAFQRKQHQWAFLQANIGLYSVHFARHLANGSSCQPQPKRWLSEEIPFEGPQAEQEEPQVEPEGKQVEPQVEPVPEEPREGEDLVAPPASNISLEAPLSAVEKEMGIAFTARKTKNKRLCVVFRYKKPWGPGNKLNFSPYYPDKATAARAILQWAGPKWSERVFCFFF